MKRKVDKLLTNLTGRQIHTSSQQISKGAVFCHLLIDKDRTITEQVVAHISYASCDSGQSADLMVRPELNVEETGVLISF